MAATLRTRTGGNGNLGINAPAGTMIIMKARKGVRVRKARPGSAAGDVCPICHTEILTGQQIGAASWSKWAHTECLTGRAKVPMIGPHSGA